MAKKQLFNKWLRELNPTDMTADEWSVACDVLRDSGFPQITEAAHLVSYLRSHGADDATCATAEFMFRRFLTGAPTPEAQLGGWVIGIDPGAKGAIVATNGNQLKCWPMPVVTMGKEAYVDFNAVRVILAEFASSCGFDVPVFLERAVSFGMGTKGAFTYGRGFEAIVIALELEGYAYTLVEPGKWAKEMHEGISKDIKPKVKSLIALKRLFPSMLGGLPKNSKGVLHDGAVDALLIAGYGLRKLGIASAEDVGDFF